MTPKIVDKDAKKFEIIQAAIGVFAKNGVVKSRMIDIARAAGVGKGTIYEYFRSKEDIFIAAYNYFYRQTQAMMNQALQASQEPEQQLKNLIRVSLSGFFENNAEFLEIMMDFWAEGIRKKNERIIEAINLKAIYRQYRALIRAIIDRGIRQHVFRPINSQVVASFLIGSLDGLLLQWIMEPDLFDIDEVTKTIIDGFLNGLKTK